MILIDKRYIIKKLAKRSGKCRKCGQCCKGCNHLSKHNLCNVHSKRPAFVCHQQFPIDSLDQKVWGVKNCGYRFKKH